MPITLNCPKCRKPFRVRDESAGMRVKCPSCGAVLQVPATISPTSFSDPQGQEAAAASSSPHLHAPPAPPATGPAADSLLAGLPSAPTAGPPSIPGAAINQPEADSVPRPLPPVPAAPRRAPAGRPRPAAPNRATDQEIIDEAAGWASVRGGMRWIQIGLLFSTLYAVYVFGVSVYCFQMHTSTLHDIDAGTAPKGFLEINRPGKGAGKYNLFEEIQILLLPAAGVLLFLFGMVGLLKCMNVPDSASTRGLVSGTALLSFIALAAYLLWALPEVRKLFTLPDVPHEATSIADRFVLHICLLTGAWLVCFMGQAGAALRSGRVLTDAAYSALLVVLFIIGVQVADNYFYPLTLSSPKFSEDKMIETFLIETAINAILAVLVASRLISLAGSVRSAIRRWREENQAALGTAAA